MEHISSSNDMDIALFQACSEANLTLIQQLVDLNVDLNHIIGPPGHLNYPINIAAGTGSVTFARFLLHHGASVNPGAIREAAFRDDLPMTLLLLEPIKDQLSQDGSEKRWRKDLATILKGATEHGHGEIAKELQVFRGRVGHFDDSVLNTGLIAAVQAGRSSSVEHFLSMGATDTAGALAAAAEYKSFELLQYFLRSFKYAPDDLLRTMVFSAASGHILSILLLINHGAQDDGTALIQAAKFGHFDIAQCLLEKFEYRPEMLNEALIHAASAGDTTMMGMLIEKGAQGSGALVPAVRKDHIPAITLLLERCNHSPAELSRALGAAMFVWLHTQTQSATVERPPHDIGTQQTLKSPEEHATTEMLLARGARLSSNCYCRVVELMIVLDHEFGDEFLEQRHRYTVLETLPDKYLVSLAVYHKRQHMARTLLDILISCVGTNELDEASLKVLAGTIAANKETTCESIPTPLHAAVLVQDEQMCKLLVERSEPRINTWCSYLPNKTPSSYYGSYKKTFTPEEEQFEELKFSFGKHSFDECALSSAIRKRNLPIIDLLIEYGADPWMNRSGISIFNMAAERNMLRHLVASLRREASECGFRATKPEREGLRTVLHWAAVHGDGEVINDLSTQKAQLDVRDAKQRSPLHLAVEAGKGEAVKALLWAGASTRAKDLEHCLLPEELAVKMLEQTGRDDLQWDERLEISLFLEKWVKNNMDQLDGTGIRQEARLVEDKAGKIESVQMSEGEWVDHFSDDESVHFSDDEG